MTEADVSLARFFDHEQNTNGRGLEHAARTLNTALCALSQGPDGVGVSELKRRLLISDPDCYGVTVPCKTQVHLLPARPAGFRSV